MWPHSFNILLSYVITTMEVEQPMISTCYLGLLAQVLLNHTLWHKDLGCVRVDFATLSKTDFNGKLLEWYRYMKMVHNSVILKISCVTLQHRFRRELKV